MSKELKNKIIKSVDKVQQLMQEAGAIAFARFDDPEKSMAIPANMKTLKRLMKETRHTIREIENSINEVKSNESTETVNR